MRAPLPLLAALAFASTGCYTLRAGIGPTLDSEGHPGLMARVEAGIGMGFPNNYAFTETVGFSSGVGKAYGDGDPPVAGGLLAGLELMRHADGGKLGWRGGPTFRFEIPSLHDEEDE